MSFLSEAKNDNHAEFIKSLLYHLPSVTSVLFWHTPGRLLWSIIREINLFKILKDLNLPAQHTIPTVLGNGLSQAVIVQVRLFKDIFYGLCNVRRRTWGCHYALFYGRGRATQLLLIRK